MLNTQHDLLLPVLGKLLTDCKHNSRLCLLDVRSEHRRKRILNSQDSPLVTYLKNGFEKVPMNHSCCTDATVGKQEGAYEGEQRVGHSQYTINHEVKLDIVLCLGHVTPATSWPENSVLE